VTLIRDLKHLPDDVRGGAISVGNFDGVHRGHASLMSRLVAMSGRIGGPSVAVTFDPHPAAFLHPASVPPRLTEIERRAELLSQCGVEHVVVCPTSKDLLEQTSRQFFDRVLIEQLGARGMVEGPNFFFGRHREGDRFKLATYCQEANVELEIVEPVKDDTDSEWVSSTEVRRCLASGDITGANRLLTRPYRLTGTVVHGDGRGKGLGFPTANLEQITTLVPAAGVYATLAFVDGESYKSATHIGPNLTFDSSGGGRVETHIMGLDQDLYGSRLSIELIARIRDITKFESVAMLVEQLNRDIKTAAEQLTL
jgi:riboflavin kinase/FMN adenylyltransferase